MTGKSWLYFSECHLLLIWPPHARKMLSSVVALSAGALSYLQKDWQKCLQQSVSFLMFVCASDCEHVFARAELMMVNSSYQTHLLSTGCVLGFCLLLRKPWLRGTLSCLIKQQARRNQRTVRAFKYWEPKNVNLRRKQVFFCHAHKRATRVKCDIWNLCKFFWPFGLFAVSPDKRLQTFLESFDVIHGYFLHQPQQSSPLGQSKLKQLLCLSTQHKQVSHNWLHGKSTKPQIVLLQWTEQTLILTYQSFVKPLCWKLF